MEFDWFCDLHLWDALYINRAADVHKTAKTNTMLCNISNLLDFRLIIGRNMKQNEFKVFEILYNEIDAAGLCVCYYTEIDVICLKNTYKNN